MELRVLSLPPLGANCYLLRQPGRLDGVVIDPGGAPEAVVNACRELEMTPAAILLTHGHFDHVGGVDGLLDAYPGLPVYVHPGDLSSSFAPSDLFPLDPASLPSRKELSDNETLSIAGIELYVFYTPGHSKGSVVFLAEDYLFTGDILFCGSMGRTDFPGGDDGEMFASLKRLAELGEQEGDFAVCPGHDRSTTLETERAHNPYLREAMAR